MRNCKISEIPNLMQKHVTPISESLPTDLTLVRSFPSVSPHVLSQQHFSAERLRTQVALVGFMPCVDSDVHIVCDPLIETLVAPLALVLFRISMNFEVTAEVAFVIERFTTNRTCARKLMSPFMARTVVSIISQLTEFLPTVPALELSLR
jgi:hypothetical protein